MTSRQRLAEANQHFQKGRYKAAYEIYDALVPSLSGQLKSGVAFNRKLSLERLEAMGEASTSARSKPSPSTQPQAKTSPGFDDFDDMLRRTYLDPEIKAPFSEAVKRSFAFSDVLAKHYEATALELCKNTTVSVLMAAYNSDDTLNTAVDSVLRQSHTKFELHIIDDGSTDNTLQIARSLASTDRRIHVHSNRSNLGKAASLNSTVKSTSGEWIAYLDADNKWHDRYLASMLGAASEHDDLEALFSGQYLFKGQSDKPYAARLASFNINLLLNRNYIDHNSFIHRKNLFENVGYYDAELRRCLDYDFFIRVASEAKCASVPLLLTDYYYGGAKQTITANRESIEDMHKVRTRAQDILVDQSNPLESLQGSLHGLDGIKLPRITVVIPSYESQASLKQCLDQLYQLPEKDRLDIVIVDNNSSDGVQRYLHDEHTSGQIKLVQLEYNYGFTYAVNRGIQESDPDTDIILLNNDAFPYPGSLDLLSRYSICLDEAGIVVPAQILPPHTPTIQTHVPFARKEAYTDVNASLHHDNLLSPPIISRGEVFKIKFAPFFCAYIPRSTIDKVGLLDSELGRHYRSDRLYSNSVRRIANSNIYYTPRARVGHSLQQSTHSLRASNDAGFKEMFALNRWEEEQRQMLGYKLPVWS